MSTRAACCVCETLYAVSSPCHWNIGRPGGPRPTVYWSLTATHGGIVLNREVYRWPATGPDAWCFRFTSTFTGTPPADAMIDPDIAYWGTDGKCCCPQVAVTIDGVAAGCCRHMTPQPGHLKMVDLSLNGTWVFEACTTRPPWLGGGTTCIPRPLTRYLTDLTDWTKPQYCYGTHAPGFRANVWTFEHPDSGCTNPLRSFPITSASMAVRVWDDHRCDVAASYLCLTVWQYITGLTNPTSLPLPLLSATTDGTIAGIEGNLGEWMPNGMVCAETSDRRVLLGGGRVRVDALTSDNW